MSHLFVSKLPDALSIVACGFSLIPIEPGGKAPVAGVAWQPYQKVTPTASVINDWFGKDRDIAVICGAVSGMLEVMDFDNPRHAVRAGHFTLWWATILEYGYSELRGKLVVAQTPSGGYHVFYRCRGGIEGNKKLAQLNEKLDGKEVLVETRGEGGYVLVAPSSGYTWKQGNLQSVPEITTEERDFLLRAAKMYDERVEEPKYQQAPRLQGSSDKLRPGDIYNERENCHDLIQNLGWTQVGSNKGARVGYRRPGKTKGTLSGTVTRDGKSFHCFSSNASPFDQDSNHDAFGIFALTEHCGDFSKARQAVIDKYKLETPKVERPIYGFGSSAPIPVLNDEAVKGGFAFEDVEDFDYLPPTFGIFGRFLRSGQINLLDAPESIGKTKLVLKWAANMSRGWCDYYDVEIPKKKTLIFTTEDDGGDIHESYRECKGEEGYLKIYREVVDLRGDELKRLEETIRANDFGLVVFDPLLSYMHGVSDINSAKAVNEYLVPIRKVAMDTGACILNIRHFNRSTVDIPRARRAGGSIQFNSCHRSQIVIDWHLERKGVRVCTHERASNRVKKIEEPFGWDINASGLIEWIFDPEMLEQGRGR